MEKLLEEEIIPDVINKLPEQILDVSFQNKVSINLGNQLLIRNVQFAPVHVNWIAKPEKFYTLCLTDPDAPNRQKPVMRERVHWLVGNIPGEEIYSKEISKGTNLIEYVPSCPPKGSGLHRYTFVLYEQPYAIHFENEKKIDRSKELWDLRKNFSINKFGKKYSLGNPIAANFYTAEWDEDAEITRQELGLA